MDIKFSKNTGNSQPAPDEKKKQGPLVVLLLILIGGFTYIYFFTDLIKPQEAQKVAAVPAAAPQAVKMPLPPRNGEPVKPSDKTAAAVDAAKAPATAAVPAVVPAAVPATKPVAAPAKPANEPAKKLVEPPKKPEAVKAPDKKTVPASATDKKPVTANTEADNKSAVTKEAVKPVTSVPAKAGTVSKTKPATTKPLTIIVGSYVLEKDLSSDVLRVRKSGFEPVVKPGKRKKAVMNRLLVSEYNDRASAQSMLDNLSRHTSDAFVIEQGSKFVVYAGSYLQIEAANKEKERLNGAGFNTTLKTAAIAIPSQNLSVGPFKNKESAESARVKLKNAGIKAVLSQQ